MDAPLNLTRLRYFECLAATLHFGQAATQLHIAQPALSQQIAKLESELGVDLFDRTSRKVRLTRSGTFLQGQASRLLVNAADLVLSVEQIESGHRGTLRLGFVDSAAYETVPHFLRSYRSMWPEVQFELNTMSSDDQIAALASGQIDVGIVRTIGDATNTRTLILQEGQLYAAISKHHRLASNSTITLGELANEDFVGLSTKRSHTLHGELTALLAQTGVTYAPAMQAAEYTTILGLVAVGEGVALVPEWITSDPPRGIVYLRIVDPVATTRLLLLGRADDPQPIVQAAFDVVAEKISPHPVGAA